MKVRTTAWPDGFVEKKGPQGARHADPHGWRFRRRARCRRPPRDGFELTPGAPEEIRDLIGRVEAAATRYGRSGKIRFALPVRSQRPAARRTRVRPTRSASAARGKVAQTLLGYAALGICEFMVSGLDDEDAIVAFARDIAPVFQRTVPIQAARRDVGFPETIAAEPVGKLISSRTGARWTVVGSSRFESRRRRSPAAATEVAAPAGGTTTRERIKKKKSRLHSLGMVRS